ncbi:hypothetical protein [Allosediminivita pacifica]|uniref:Uncharacterized protein n=1 Tax=Allosediminivita pacifica TaxID=1267769 RepID=A0A2T6B7P3_9RHOB|nr:hypothetical protein [Allosediminivita pacifica]PTX52075.1 hypothetical protein C8N44_102120 [Allosediminivita pacifica]GGA97362.1 hypothetical protein GCM10011324_04530 [Allosediminivita pacifica]
MSKLIAILNVVAWSGFWAFGYLALTSDPTASGRMVTAVVLAALGAAAGLWAWFWIVRHSEETGYAPAPPRARPE